MKTNLPEVNGDGYRLVNRTSLALKTKNGRKHEITSETLISAHHPNGLHRASGGGTGWSKKYFVSVSSTDIAERDAKLAEWLASKPELQEV
jgi:hypothetical protein